MKTGVFGGTFDPVHNGHIAVARHACEYLECTRVIFVPAWQQPQKLESTHNSRTHHRCAMLTLATGAYDEFIVSPLELDRGGTSYTSDTLEILHREMPDAELYLIIGADNYMSFSAWHDPERILAHATVVVHDRPGTELNTISPPFQRLGGCTPDISSRMIRRRVADGLSIDHLVPAPVHDYIVTHNLYTSHV